MDNAPSSPLATYLAHLEQGHLAYQFSPEAAAPVFFPRVICPRTGSTNLQWRISAGLEQYTQPPWYTRSKARHTTLH